MYKRQSPQYMHVVARIHIRSALDNHINIYQTKKDAIFSSSYINIFCPLIFVYNSEIDHLVIFLLLFW